MGHRARQLAQRVARPEGNGELENPRRVAEPPRGLSRVQGRLERERQDATRAGGLLQLQIVRSSPAAAIRVATSEASVEDFVDGGVGVEK